MIQIEIILLIMILHWFADFVVQSDEQAKGKSTDFKYLVEHVGEYSALMGFFLYFVFLGLGAVPEMALYKSILFSMITFVSHLITDFFTSRLNSKLWKAGRVHDFFVSIGFDQWLHYTQLFITYLLLV